MHIQALSDSYDLLMGAAQKLNPYQKSFNMNYLAIVKRVFCKYMISCVIKCSGHALFRMHCAQATLQCVIISPPL